MDLSHLPKDVLMLLALEMDIEYVINLCQSSSLFNNKICKDNHFWLNKLFKEFGIRTELSKAKYEYLSLRNMLKNKPNDVLESGIKTENYTMVKTAIESGANPNLKIGSSYPITLSMFLTSDEILLFLLNKVNYDDIKLIIGNMITKFEYYSKNKKCVFFTRFIGIFLPYASKFMPKNEWKPFWSKTTIKLEELNRTDKDCISDEFYNKWIGFYKELSEN